LDKIGNLKGEFSIALLLFYRFRQLIGDDIDSKVYKAMSFVGESRDVKDPWYTGNFDETYDDISRSCDALLELIKARI